MSNMYDDLGVHKDADQETIKKAYRQKAKKTHPDNGGKSDEFRTIAKAYNILSDDEKRKRYDNGENPDNINQNTHEQQVMGAVFNLFNIVVDRNIDLDHNDLFDIIRQNLRSNQQNFKNEKDEHQKNIDRYNNILKRIKKKDESVFFIHMLDDKIRGCKGAISQLDESINVCKDALKLIEECEYEIDPQQVYFRFSSTTAC